MLIHFANNKPFLLLNKHYASYDNQIICDEFGMFFRMIIMQFHNLTNTVNKATFAKQITDLANNQTMTTIKGIWQECLQIDCQ